MVKFDWFVVEVTRVFYYISTKSFIRYKKIDVLPNKNKLILGVTSLWMNIPIAHGIVRWLQDDVEVGQKIIIVTLLCSCITSTLFWMDAKSGSLFHKLDKLSAIQYIACMVFVTTQPLKSASTMLSKVNTFLPLSMITFFLLGDMSFKQSLYDRQLCFHLLFRYIGYWWGHLLLVPVENNFIASFIILSVGYFGHIISFNEVIIRRGLLLSPDIYLSSYVIIAFWILICGHVHTLISYTT